MERVERIRRAEVSMFVSRSEWPITTHVVRPQIQVLVIGGNRLSKSMSLLAIDELSNFVVPIKDRPADLSPADERKLKNFERLYQLAKVRRDRVQMASLEKQIFSLRFGRLL